MDPSRAWPCAETKKSIPSTNKPQRLDDLTKVLTLCSRRKALAHLTGWPPTHTIRTPNLLGHTIRHQRASAPALHTA